LETDSLDNLGAGDAFFSSFIAGRILEKGYEACLQMAVANAGSVITQVGAQQGLLTSDELEGRLEQVPKITKI